jgi:hypothetical protein
MTENDIAAMARGKARGVALEYEWRTAIARMASTGVSEANLGKLLAASASPVAFSRLALRMADGANECCAQLFESCAKASHELPQWLESIDAVYRWLEKRSRTTPFANAAGYVACAAEAAEGTTLTDAVKRMLDEYGVE